MNHDQLLEDRLRSRPIDAPPSALRDRVLRAINAELSGPAKQTDHWYWIALAASVLIVLNVSLMVGSREEFSNGPMPRAHAMADELHAVLMLEAQQEHK